MGDYQDSDYWQCAGVGRRLVGMVLGAAVQTPEHERRSEAGASDPGPVFGDALSAGHVFVDDV